MKKTMLLLFGSLSLIAAQVAVNDFEGVNEYLCLDMDNLDNYANQTLPVHYNNNVFNTFDNTPANNSITDKGATLGRVLFYDKQLSINNSTACASCHAQTLGFTDTALLSIGFDGIGLTDKHSMRLGNTRFYPDSAMFWDKRAASVETQSTQPIQNEVEMGYDAVHGGMGAVINKMNTLPYYPELFEFVYGDTVITEARIQLALAQFVRSIMSVNSKFDAGFAQVFAPQPGGNVAADFPNFTASENRGKTLFLNAPNNGGAGCAGCHSIPTFGLVANTLGNGLDAGETTVFKSPSLKNIGLYGPYMHDGRFATLAEVVEHYNSGVQVGPATDPKLLTPPGPGGPQALQLNLTNQDKVDLVAFLNTLTDSVVITDAKFSDPFCKTPTSITTVGRNLQFSVFPNPVNGVATIKYSNIGKQQYNLYLTDLSGKTVWQQTDNTGNAYLYTDGLSSGLYLLVIEGNGIKETKKVMVQ
jgi:cytochrome c peroxidase